GRRIRNRPGTKRIEECGVVAPQFDVIEHEPTAQRVVRDVENMVRITVRAAPLQDLQLRIERLDESDFVHELVERADAATCNRMITLSHLEVDLASAELGPIPERCLPTLCRFEACCDLPDFRCELSPYRLIHLKTSASFGLCL